MIDSHVVELARKKALLLIEKQNPEIDRLIGVIKAKAASRGMLRSGSCVLEITQVCKEATQERAKFVWASLQECLTAVGVNYFEGLDSQAKQFVFELVPDHANWAKWRVDDAANFMANPAMKLELTRQVEDANQAALHSTTADIDLFVLTLKNRKLSTMPGQTVNISHARNIVVQQSGKNSTATVTQTSKNLSSAELVALLDEIKAAINSVESVPGHSKPDLTELIDDTKTEVAKVTPNQSKLKGYFHTLTGVVEDLSTLVEKGPILYESFKALAVVGWGLVA